MIGKVAKCSKGKVGLITGRKKLPWGLSWVGVGEDGKSWASRNPKVVAESAVDYVRRFGGGTAWSEGLQTLS